jgi:alkylation response protein AidB-like acyl-CoA dehydrogenase
VVVTRSDPNAPKHKGLTYFFLDMKSPGIEIRRIKQISGASNFNEVYFTDVRIPDSQRLGGVGGGWGVAITTLAHERDVLTHIRHISLRNALHRLITLVKERGAAGDPLVRQKIADLYISEQALQMNGYRGLTNIMRGGHPGPQGSTAKLLWSQTDVALAQTATEILGPYSQLAHGTDWAPDEGQWEFYELLARGSGIRAGTTEILKNILGERVLGLP